MTTALLVVLVLSVLYLALRVHRLHLAVVELARVVNKPRRRDRAILKQIAALEDDLEHIRDLVKEGVADQNDFIQTDLIREKLDRRLRALAGQPQPKPQSTSQPPPASKM